jgi:predicted Ser/Thr protein kinase
VSFWQRLFRGGEGEPEPTPEAPEADAGSAEAEEETEVEATAEEQLSALGDGPTDDLDVASALELVERVRDEGREARAIDLARRVVLHHPEALAIHLRVAELLASRGDDEGAARLVAPFLDRTDSPLDLLMLGAEIAERRGDRVGALALYERVVARDLDYPRARNRVARLREGERRADAGATLMGDGALTRSRYKVERELGRGGAGTVFLAEDVLVGRRVALKIYHRRGRAERERLLAEARIPASLTHPGVIRIFDLDEGLAAIVMERVRGGSVRLELRRGNVDEERLRRWWRTTVETVAHLHEAGVVHRDLKPSNLLLRDDDRAVVTDFGVAVSAGAAVPAEGTLAYMAPEQKAGAPAKPAMDIHALGITLRELLLAVPGADESWRLLAEACTAADPAARPTATDLLAEAP